MKKEEKPGRYGINGAVMDNPDMSDELRADYENPDYATGWRSSVWPHGAALLYALGAFFMGVAWGQSSASKLPVAPVAYIIIGVLTCCAASLLQWRWERKKKAGK